MGNLHLLTDSFPVEFKFWIAVTSVNKIVNTMHLAIIIYVFKGDIDVNF